MQILNTKDTYTRKELQYIYDEGIVIRANTKLSKFIISLTPLLTFKPFPKQRLWHILNSTNNIPHCKMCTATVKWDDAKPTKLQQYRTYCSKKCQQNDPDNRQRKSNTELARYGKDRSNIVKKGKNTLMKRYGVDSPSKLPNYKQKRDETLIKKYGTTNILSIDGIKEKRDNTNKERYGDIIPARTTECKLKTKETCCKKYGSEKERYQASSAKTIQTCQQKFNRDYFSQSHIPDKSLKLLHDKNWLYDQNERGKNLTTIALELGVHPSSISRFFKHHSITPKRSLTSTDERELYDFLTTHNIDAIINDRSIISPKELDFYIPKQGVAIEFNGIYWHSEIHGKRNNKYHINKHNDCEQKNIQLIQVWEHEWKTKKEITMSRLLSKLGVTNKKLYARKCTIEVLDAQTARDFFTKNHIQGSCPSSVNLGLILNEEVVSCMSFIKSRFSKKYQFELLRFASLINTQVIGGAGKLFKHFVRNYNPQSIVSYSDVRWGSGDVYTKIGFTLKNRSKPNYYYFKPGSTLTLHSRIKFQKHKLHKQLKTFDPELTEWQNMTTNGYDRMWDCGNDVFVWKNY